MAKCKAGDLLECIASHSNAYKVGKVYKVVKHPVTDSLCIEGSDGFLDPLGMLVSKFKPLESKVINMKGDGQ